jgi:hypothetical protein
MKKQLKGMKLFQIGPVSGIFMVTFIVQKGSEFYSLTTTL